MRPIAVHSAVYWLAVLTLGAAEQARLSTPESADDLVAAEAGENEDAVEASLQLALLEPAPSSTEPSICTPETSRADAEQLLATLSLYTVSSPFADQLRLMVGTPDSGSTARGAEDSEAARKTPHELFIQWLGIITNRVEPTAAQEYLPRIQTIFESESLPGELAWLAEVESAFDPHAKSPVGAVGLFQIMPETAASLGLSTRFPDERRNAEKNAAAAARYLRHLHDRFGDWPLALAAYNAGPTRVSRLLRKNGVSSYEAIAHTLPSETVNYVAKIEATLLVRTGVQLNALPRPEEAVIVNHTE